METWVAAVLGGIGVAVIGVLGNVILEWQRRRKTGAEAGQSVAAGADSVVGSALEMVKEMRTDMALLKARIVELEAAIKERDCRITKLEKHIAMQDITIADLVDRLRALSAEPQPEAGE
jgi:hypothetical protein